MTTETDAMLKAALAYAEARWSVVPMVRKSKQPLVPWLEFQQRRATPEEIRDWFRRWPEANIAVVTGAISNIVVIDIDPRHGGEKRETHENDQQWIVCPQLPERCI